MVAWRVGGRNAWHTQRFMYDVASRLANRVQLTTDGHRVYLDAVELAFGEDIDYAMLVKLYSSDRSEGEVRDSPAECIGCRFVKMKGYPQPRHISTSFVERQNLTMRMQMRRFTRLTNAFSKKLDNHNWALALHYMIACTTISAGFTKRYALPRQCKRASLDHVWSIEELVGLLDGRALGSSRRESAAHSEAVPPS